MKRVVIFFTVIYFFVILGLPNSKIFAEDRKPVIFRFLVIPSTTGALIDYIRIVDSKGEVLSILDIGDKDNNPDANHVIINSEGRWGNPKIVDGYSIRPVNEGPNESEQSQFLLFIPYSCKISELRIVIRYKDEGEDLLPIEIFDGEEFRRIAQILLENSGAWLIEEFKIPPLEIKE